MTPEEEQIFNLRTEIENVRQNLRILLNKNTEQLNKMRAIQAQVNELEYHSRNLTDENRRLMEHNAKLAVSLQIKTDQVKTLTSDLDTLTVRAGELMITAATSQRRAYPN